LRPRRCSKNYPEAVKVPILRYVAQHGGLSVQGNPQFRQRLDLLDALRRDQLLQQVASQDLLFGRQAAQFLVQEDFPSFGADVMEEHLADQLKLGRHDALTGQVVQQPLDQRRLVGAAQRFHLADDGVYQDHYSNVFLTWILR
jgi:hypothetical protein